MNWINEKSERCLLCNQDIEWPNNSTDNSDTPWYFKTITPRQEFEFCYDNILGCYFTHFALLS